MSETIKGISASRINTGSISADKIVAGSITCDSIGDNVLRGHAARRLHAGLGGNGRPILAYDTQPTPEPDPQPAPTPAPEPTPFPTEPETFRLDSTMGDYRPSTI